jgi:hypothetical protein
MVDRGENRVGTAIIPCFSEKKGKGIGKFTQKNGPPEGA